MDTRPRNRMDLWTPAELAIYNAMREVEKMGADVSLTNAVVLLSQAQNHVADFIDQHSEKLAATNALAELKKFAEQGLKDAEQSALLQTKTVTQSIYYEGKVSAFSDVIIKCEKLAATNPSDAVEWISVEDGLPTVSGNYIVYGRYAGDSPMSVMQSHYDAKSRCFRTDIKTKDVTHWQPLPAAPLQTPKQ
jgi:hypothetical protein